ncbi:cilia- and flagella-associated protein 161-like [Patiria miniata]|uniref:Cilia- and flagella-associated protein 161 n=1 Tax=Patiria miniata TaxID=46514 RepID=A0A914BS54_PATMI|nr:cilia- and flagella-associated protein 161-like [Patiria miniata]
MSVRTYNPSVRVDNWNEDICLEEDILKDFQERRDRGELAIQQSSKLKETILKKAELSVTQDGFLHFGDCVMLRNEADANQIKTQPGVEPRQANTLAVNMSEMKMHESVQFEGTCNVSGSRILEPCARNTFAILPVEAGIPEGTPLRYGQHFCFCTLPGIGGSLKLKTDIATFQSSAKKTRKQLVTFEECTTYLIHWRILHFDPQLRMETEGLPVPANQKIIFNHCKTNQDLCVISDATVRTPFGREYELVAYTDLDSHKAEKDVNHWIIQTGHPPEPTGPAATLPLGTQQ